MSEKKQGALYYDKESGRFDIRFDLDDYYGGLHCGTTLDVMINGKWVPSRIEMASDWFLVGVRTSSIAGLQVRI